MEELPFLDDSLDKFWDIEPAEVMLIFDTELHCRGVDGIGKDGSKRDSREEDEDIFTIMENEKAVVAHYCNYTIRRLVNVDKNDAKRKDNDESIKEHVASTWTRWLKGKISKLELVSSLASFARSFSDETRDILADFKVWHEKKREGWLEREGKKKKSPVKTKK